MNLKSIELSPEAASALQGVGLGDLRHAQEAAIELTRLVLGPDRYTDLDVMCCLNHLLSKFGPHFGLDEFRYQSFDTTAELEDLLHQCR